MSDTNTARDNLARLIGLAWGLLGLDADEVAAVLEMYEAEHRDEVLTEGAELIRQHRGDLDDDGPWWDTRDRDTAAQLLLNARTHRSDGWVVCSPEWLTAGGDCHGTPRRPATDPRYSHEHLAARTTDPHASGQPCADPDCGRAARIAAARRIAARTTTEER